MKIGSMLLFPQLLVGGIVLTVVESLVGLLLIFAPYFPSYPGYGQEEECLINGLILIGIAFFSNFLFGFPTWSERIILTNSGIVRYRMFKKKTYIPYSQYPCIAKGYYMHRSVMIPKLGSKVSFIVISQRKLNDSALTHINHVPSSESVIKIRYSKKAYAMLMKCLPEKQKYRLERAFEEEVNTRENTRDGSLC